MDENAVHSTGTEQAMASFPDLYDLNSTLLQNPGPHQQVMTAVMPPNSVFSEGQDSAIDALLKGPLLASLIPQDSLPHSSQGHLVMESENWDYLVNYEASNSTEATSTEMDQDQSKNKFDTNFNFKGKSQAKFRAHFSKERNLLLIKSSKGDAEPADLMLWFPEKILQGRVCFAMLHTDKAEKHNPVKLCEKHSKLVHKHHYIQGANNNPMISYCYEGGHPVLVVPLEYFSPPYEETNVKTGENGYNYHGQFHFPCYTFHHNKKSFRLVAGLEVPTEQMVTGNTCQYRCVGVTTVDVCVCSTPGRSKDSREGGKKKGNSQKRSPSKVPSDDGPSPPKQMKPAAGQCDGVGMASGGNPSSMVVPVAKEMDYDHGNAHLMASINQIRAQVTAHYAQETDFYTTTLQALDRLEEQIAETVAAPIGGNTHSYTGQ